MSRDDAPCAWADCGRPAAGPLFCEHHEAEMSDGAIAELLRKRSKQRLSAMAAQRPDRDPNLLAETARIITEIEAAHVGPERLARLIDRGIAPYQTRPRPLTVSPRQEPATRPSIWQILGYVFIVLAFAWLFARFVGLEVVQKTQAGEIANVQSRIHEETEQRRIAEQRANAYAIELQEARKPGLPALDGMGVAE